MIAIKSEKETTSRIAMHFSRPCCWVGYYFVEERGFIIIIIMNLIFFLGYTGRDKGNTGRRRWRHCGRKYLLTMLTKDLKQGKEVAVGTTHLQSIIGGALQMIISLINLQFCNFISIMTYLSLGDLKDPAQNFYRSCWSDNNSVWLLLSSHYNTHRSFKLEVSLNWLYFFNQYTGSRRPKQMLLVHSFFIIICKNSQSVH